MPVKCVSDELRDAILFFIDKHNHMFITYLLNMSKDIL